MTPLLRFDSVNVRFKRAHDWDTVVHDVSFAIQAGETLALVGESGSGKSVCAHSILKLHAQANTRYQGQILFNEQNLLELAPSVIQAVRQHDIGIIFQEPSAALNPLHTVGKQLIESCQLANPLGSKQQHQQHALTLLNDVQLPSNNGLLKRYPHQLSGGQRQRIMIAMAMAKKPSLLIADEPTTALDKLTQIEILRLLKSLQINHNLSILFITHDLTAVKSFADTVTVMHNGRLCETNTTERLFSQPSHAYTQSLLRPMTYKKNSIPSLPTPTLIVKNLAVNIRQPTGLLGLTKKNIPILSPLSFTLHHGETLAVIGESGSGKSTLAKAIMHLVPYDGEIEHQGIALHQLSPAALRQHRRHCQMIFQDPYLSLSPRLSVAEIVSEGLIAQQQNLTEKQVRQQVLSTLAKVGLDPDCQHRYPHHFSGGQRQRIAIARAIITHPQCLILDEPTSALDHNLQHQIIELLTELQTQSQLSYLFISHDIHLIKSIAHRVLIIKHGQIIEQGTVDSLIQKSSNPYTNMLIHSKLNDLSVTATR